MDAFQQHFQAAIPALRTKMLNAFNISSEHQLGFRSVWEHFEDIVVPILKDFLTSDPLKVPANNISQATSKSAYPDLKISFEGRTYAIDVKSGEAHINPWYDISRMDTYERAHLAKYAAEYSVVIKWAGRDKTEVLNIFIEPTFQTVGLKRESNGILYRPYDGKIRPKPWADFENGVSHWRDKDHFIQGLAVSKAYRRRSFIAEWYKEMDAAQRELVRGDLEAIDAGQLLLLDDVKEADDTE